jgi:hypothetical protein
VGGTLHTFLKDLGPALVEKYKPKGIVVFSAHWESPPNDIKGSISLFPQKKKKRKKKNMCISIHSLGFLSFFSFLPEVTDYGDDQPLLYEFVSTVHIHNPPQKKKRQKLIN